MAFLKTALVAVVLILFGAAVGAAIVSMFTARPYPLRVFLVAGAALVACAALEALWGERRWAAVFGAAGEAVLSYEVAT